MDTLIFKAKNNVTVNNKTLILAVGWMNVQILFFQNQRITATMQNLVSEKRQLSFKQVL